MGFAFFWVPAAKPDQASEELNGFIGSHRVVRIDRQFGNDGGQLGWSVCVEYLTGQAIPQGKIQGAERRIDYREVLDAETFSLFCALRQRRKELAEKEGIPIYAVATNEHLAEIARRRVGSLAELQKIEGIGESRIRKYGTLLLASLSEVRKSKEDVLPNP